MDETRYSKMALFLLFDIYRKENFIDKYNWLKALCNKFLAPIGEEGVLEGVEMGALLLEGKIGQLVRKYIEFRRRQDWESCLESTSLIWYSYLAYESSFYLLTGTQFVTKSFIAQLRLTIAG